MSINLIESGRTPQRSLGGTFVSIALHATLITIAVYATANAGVVAEKVPIATVTVFYPPQPKKPPHTPNAPDAPAHPDHTPALPREPVPRAPIDIPDKLPPIDSSIGRVPAESLFTSGVSGTGKHGAGTLTGSDSGEPLLASEVDKPVTARDGNPIPRYPSLLESSRVEGTVLVQFVVDTLGRADMQTFKVLESSDELFAESLESTLPKWRFYPAEAGGRKVKQVVQLPLKFVAPRR